LKQASQEAEDDIPIAWTFNGQTLYIKANGSGQQLLLSLAERWPNTGLAFTSTHGTPLEPRNVIRLFRRILQKAGLPHKRFYDLRHTCATLLLVQGVQPRVVMEILGHSQISLTMNTYSYVSPTLQREAASRMDDVLSRKTS